MLITLFLLTTPVVFWVGSRFYTGAIKALKQKTTDMNTLVAVGALSAYLYSVLATFSLRSADQLRDIELLKEGGKQKYSGRFRVKTFPVKLTDGDRFRTAGHFRSLDGKADLETGASGKFRKTFLGQNPLYGADGDLYPFFRKKLCNLTGGNFTLPERADLLADLTGHPVTGGASFRDRLREIKLSGDKLMPQEVDIAHRVSETFPYGMGGKAVYEGGPESFVSSLPVMDRMGEESFVAHGNLI